MTAAVAIETLKIIAADADALAMMRDYFAGNGTLDAHVGMDVTWPLARVARDVTDPYANNEILALLADLSVAPYRTIVDVGDTLRDVVRLRLS